jgi:hypothetical protein
VPDSRSRCYHFLGMDTPLPLFDPSIYPRTYRVSLGYGFFLFLLGGIVFVAGCLGTWYFGTGHEMRTPTQAGIMAACSFLFVLLGTYLIAFILRFKVILQPDAIVVQEPFTARTLLRSDISGLRVLPTKYISTLVLVPRSEHQKKLMLALRSDATFTSWLADFPNLDAEELEQSQNDLVLDPDLGFESVERSRSVVRAKKLSNPLNAAAVIACIWSYLSPRPYSVVIPILSVLPLIALALLARSGGIYQIEGRRNDARPSLAPLFIFPALALALRAVLDLNLLHWKPLLVMSALFATVITLLIAQADRSVGRRPAALLLISLFAATYFYGLTAEANSLLDHSTPQAFRIAVVGKHVSDDKSPSYYLHLDPWGPQTSATEVSVPSSLYESTSISQQVCVYLHSGALRIPWYVVAQCL